MFFLGNTQIQALLALLLVVIYVVMHVFAKVFVSACHGDHLPFSFVNVNSLPFVCF